MYEEITKESDLDVMTEQLEAKAINEVKKAVSMTFQVLVDLHTKVKIQNNFNINFFQFMVYFIYFWIKKKNNNIFV